MKIRSSYFPHEVGEPVNNSYDEATIQHQYDTLIKNVLKNEAKSYLRELKQKAENDAKLIDLFAETSLVRIDKYQCECTCYQIGRRRIYIEDEALSNAIQSLSLNQRIITLLSYFEDMSDEEIGRELHLDRSTIFRNRKKALNQIKAYMEKMRYD